LTGIFIFKEIGLMPRMISESRFNRRWHALSAVQVQHSHSSLSLAGEDYRGYCAAKRRYFYGFRVHLITTTEGFPVELAFLPGEANDAGGLSALPLVLPAGSEVFMDAGYTDYKTEDDIGIADGIRFSVGRKKNSQR
jgi:hypothetical protein